MSNFEYVLPLISVVAGLALVDLLTSLHRLVVARDRIRFDWIPFVMAAGIFLAVLNWWWAFYRDRNAVWLGNYFMVTVRLTELVLLYLAASIVLPDAVSEEPELQLIDYYWSQAPILYGILAFYIVIISLFTVLVQDLALFGTVQVIRIGIFAVCTILALSRSRVVHMIGVPILVAVLIAFVAQFAVSI